MPTAPLQVGVPSQRGFPALLWSRLARKSSLAVLQRSVGYPDPCGEPALRRAIAAQLALSRGLVCAPAHVLVTAGYGAGLRLVLQVLGLAGRQAWTEEPGYPVVHAALRQAGIAPVPVAIDAQGFDAQAALVLAPAARLAVVTPGQHAPLGVAMAPARRRALLDWAGASGGWIVEDDYLGALQLAGRAAPALAAMDAHDRTVHVGTFSKTLSPALRLGFVVFPAALAVRAAQAAATTDPAPSALLQHTLLQFIEQGHHMRHLRRMKLMYRQQAEALRAAAARAGVDSRMAGLSLLVRLPPGADDQAVAARARAAGLAPSALSGWYADRQAAVHGLLLGVTNVEPARARAVWRGLAACLG